MNTAAVENPMARNAAKVYEASLLPQATDEHMQAATVAVLADIGAWTDTIAAECDGHSAVDSERAQRLPGRLLDATTAELMHALLTSDHLAAVVLRQRLLDSEHDRVRRMAAYFAQGGE